MDFKKDLLLRCGARLYSLGVDLEGKRGEIQRLVEEGVDYSSSEMLQALSEYIANLQQVPSGDIWLMKLAATSISIIPLPQSHTRR